MDEPAASSEPGSPAPRRRADLPDLAGLAGLVSVTVGAGMIYLPLAFIVPGVLLLAFALVAASRR